MVARMSFIEAKAMKVEETMSDPVTNPHPTPAGTQRARLVDRAAATPATNTSKATTTRLRTRPATTPTWVVVCGSYSHPDLITAAVRAEEAAGRQVLAYPQRSDIPATAEAVTTREWIELADEVVVVTKPDGRISDAIRYELSYAERRGKTCRIAGVSAYLAEAS